METGKRNPNLTTEKLNLQYTQLVHQDIDRNSTNRYAVSWKIPQDTDPVLAA